MSTLVFRLRNVPDDEADEVRSLLDQHRIDWYETTAGSWGIAMPALWVHSDEDLESARNLIDSYQAGRSKSERSEWQAQVDSGLAPTVLDRVKARPIASLGIIAFCLFLIYAMISPFLQFINR
ncbi:MAG: DUF6164 family protein [Granulosicoccus sp.]